MAIELQLRRGTTAENDLFTGALAEVSVDTNKHKLRVHDGSTQGGFPVALESDITDRISNCITEIPQDIKLELSAGVLTLKAGSKVYVPNGAGVFDVVTVPSDKTFSSGSGWSTKPYYFFYNSNNNTLSQSVQVYSGSTQPTGQSYMIWYDTANNLVKSTNDGGSTWTSGLSLPIGIVLNETGNEFSSIDKVFNGFGYIGSDVFALPGLSVLTPNGRNTDGTLNNRKYTFTACATYTRNISGSNIPLWVRYNGTIGLSTGITYDPITNTSVGADGYAQIGTVDLASGVISNFRPKTAFHAVDYNDTNVDFVVASQLPNSANNYTWYRKYKSGWVEQGQEINTQNTSFTFPVPMADTNYMIIGVGFTIANQGAQGISNVTTTGFSTYSSQHNSYTGSWMVVGMAA